MSPRKEDGDIPLGQQVREYVRTLIIDGELPEGAPLPSERALSELFKINRLTARRALLAIENEGLAYSDGRKGRFVAPQRLPYDVGTTVSFSARAKRAETHLTIDLISSATVQATAELSSILQVKKGTKLFTYKRLFSIRGRAAFVEVEYVSAGKFPNLLNHNLCQSSTLLMEKHYGTTAKSGYIRIRMQNIEGDDAQLLDLQSGQPGLELEQVISDEEGFPFCVGRQFWRGDFAEFSVHAIVTDDAL